MVIDGAEAGGGLLRAVIPLSYALGIPFEVLNIRAGRQDPGLGWPHVALLQALEASGVVKLEGAHMRSKTLAIQPADRIEPGTHVDVTLDDLEHTFVSTDSTVRRDYDAVEDSFSSPSAVQQRCWGVRGHAVATPLIALLPLTFSEVTMSLRGGTETPGAPFIDALHMSTLGVMQAVFDRRITIDVQRRGAFGYGGGSVVARSGNAATTNSDDDQPRFITYWSPETSESTLQRVHEARQNTDRIRKLLPGVMIDNEYYDEPCPAVNQLLILPQAAGAYARDVSFCAEEELGQVSGEAFIQRVNNEVKHREIISRFHTEQLLLWSVLLGQSGTWRTERITPHITAVVKLLEAATDAEIRVGNTAEHAEIRVG